MEIQIEGLIVIIGNYGSGKTEVAINLAFNRKLAGFDVRIADLDLVNPYFRTREAKDTLADWGIDVALPPKQYLNADLPILSPVIAGLIKNPSPVTILDVGGDDVGATVLAALADALQGRSMHCLQVINLFRPFTSTVEGCLEMRRQIEAAAKLKVTGLISNTHLMDHTTIDHIYQGYTFIKEVAIQSALPIKFITAPQEHFAKLDRNQIKYPILSLARQMVPPWRKAETVAH
jgi:hypothetical protein